MSHDEDEKKPPSDEGEDGHLKDDQTPVTTK